MRVAVIGSGPSGVATATACLDRGWTTVLFDGGRALHPRLEEIRVRMSRQRPERWAASDVAALSDRHEAGSGLGTKRLFGDAFATTTAPVLEIERDPGVRGGPSLAVGGLSNVWGATMLPYAKRDAAGWEDVFDELGPEYDRVASYVPVAAQHDALAEIYPLPRPCGPTLLRSEQMNEVLSRSRTHGAALRSRGVLVGAARLAVRSQSGGMDAGCVYCGRCLHGCVYRHIWSSSHTVDTLRRHPGFEHRPGSIVELVVERSSSVEVRLGSDAADRVPERFDRVFLAAGPISSFAILARSGLSETKARMLDSATFFLPMVWAGPPPRTAPTMTLSECFVRIEGTNGMPAAQLQLYPYNDSLVERAAALHPRLVGALRPLVGSAMRSLVIGIGYLHSDVSDAIELSWRSKTVAMAPDLDPASGDAFRSLMRRLPQDLRPLRLVPLTRLAVSEGVGQGYHFGGTYPMGSPGGSDRLGRPHGCRRVHLTDASVFPSIPAGAITFTAMANASRIVRSIEEGS